MAARTEHCFAPDSKLVTLSSEAPDFSVCNGDHSSIKR